MNSQTTKKVTLALGVASVASQFGTLAVKAGPALQTLNNLSNTAEMTINNTFGGSFSVQGAISAATGAIRPFAAITAAAAFTSPGAILRTGFIGGIGIASATNFPAGGGGLRAVSSVQATVNVIPNEVGAKNTIISTAISTIRLIAQTGTQTIGASVSTTMFGPSNIKAGSSFTSQVINDLSAF